MENNLKSSKRILKGKVVSDKMNKTIVVLVERIKEHPKYRKRYKISKRYKAHDPENKYHEGDNVMIQECKPISRDKKWIVL
jgi:small subunit ribosomal protein S17